MPIQIMLNLHTSVSNDFKCSVEAINLKLSPGSAKEVISYPLILGSIYFLNGKEATSKLKILI